MSEAPAMNVYASIQTAVLERPGMTANEVAAHLGFTAARSAQQVSAQLAKLASRKKVLRNLCRKTDRVRFYPTATCGVNLREQGKPTRDQLRAAARAAGRNGKPTDAQQFKITRPMPVRLTSIAGRAETVEEFLARGGQVQQLAPRQSGDPLRFDHSDTTTPAGRRRPVVRAYPAAAAR